MNASDKCVFRNRHRNVLARARATSLPCDIRGVRSRHRPGKPGYNSWLAPEPCRRACPRLVGTTPCSLNGELGTMWSPRTPTPDCTTRVISSPASRAPWRVIDVVAEGPHRLCVRFVDGTTGHVDMHAFLMASHVDTSVFAPLRDEALFAQAAAVDGSVRWPNGADLAPDAMYDAIRTSGLWHVPVE
jgi:hypothetical protein